MSRAFMSFTVSGTINRGCKGFVQNCTVFNRLNKLYKGIYLHELQLHKMICATNERRLQLKPLFKR